MTDAALQVSVKTVGGRELHSVKAGKMQLNFTMAADADVGKVDKSNGRVTYVGLPPLEMVRTHPASHRLGCCRLELKWNLLTGAG